MDARRRAFQAIQSRATDCIIVWFTGKRGAYIIYPGQGSEEELLNGFHSSLPASHKSGWDRALASVHKRQIVRCYGKYKELERLVRRALAARNPK